MRLRELRTYARAQAATLRLSSDRPRLIRPALRSHVRLRHDGGTQMPRLAGKVALITGAGTGIGRATAKRWPPEGAKVVVAELKQAAGEQTAQVIAQAGGECIAMPTDVTDADSIQAAIDKARCSITARCTSCTTTPAARPTSTARDRRADGGILARHQARSVRHIPRLPFRYSGDHPIRRRIGHQHVVERGADGHPRPRLLHRRQGRGRLDDPLDGGRVRAQECASMPSRHRPR